MSYEWGVLYKVFIHIRIEGIHASKKATTSLIFPSSYLNDDGSIEDNIDKENENFIRPLLDEAKGKWILIDLKSIEKYSWKNKIEYETLKDYMYRFDVLILTPIS